jgi:hypothetical protein
MLVERKPQETREIQKQSRGNYDVVVFLVQGIFITTSGVARKSDPAEWDLLCDR